MGDEDDKWSRAAAARREADAKATEERFAEREARKAAETRQRAVDAVWKAEFAFEVVTAMLDDLRKGKPVTRTTLFRAWTRLDGKVPTEVRALLEQDGFQDREMRKETPKPR
jgi:hypothetical protein